MAPRGSGRKRGKGRGDRVGRMGRRGVGREDHPLLNGTLAEEGRRQEEGTGLKGEGQVGGKGARKGAGVFLPWGY